MLAGPSVALFGGAIAERTDRRRMLVAAHGGMAALSLLLAGAAQTDRLSAVLLVGYALPGGTMAPIMTSARTPLLARGTVFGSPAAQGQSGGFACRATLSRKIVNDCPLPLSRTKSVLSSHSGWTPSTRSSAALTLAISARLEQRQC